MKGNSYIQMTSFICMLSGARFFGQQTLGTRLVLSLPFLLGKGLSYRLFGCSDSTEAMQAINKTEDYFKT